MDHGATSIQCTADQGNNDTRSSGRKREIDEIMSESPCEDKGKTKENEAAKLKKDLTAALPSFSRLRLEAIFHPKFENENLNDQQMRAKMKERVASGSGYLEVTLKHSGSLLLWSGGQRYYSKNSTSNRFTRVGEILLRQHFVRSFWNDRETMVLPENIEEQYQQCSQFVEEHRLTLAFEVVTAVLGDHGAIPKRDFLILTAVADRSKERFYSTEELIELAQRFRLPHNDSWVCASAKSVDDLFSFYDAFRETGLAQDVVKGLSNFSETHVSSLYPHIDFQGEILEGIVIRFVSYHGRTDVLESIDRLSSVAEGLQKRVPSESPVCFEMVADLSESYSSVLRTDIRQIFREVRGQEEGGALRFEAGLKDLFKQSGRTVDSMERSLERDMVPSRMKELAESDDDETRRIAVLVRNLSELNARVEYAVVREQAAESTATSDRWICIIHVFFDKTFQKFRGKAKPGDMTLFRGFAVELDNGSLDSQVNLASKNHESTIENGEGGESLMLKMKFLPYMVRTFACRNGLRVIKQGGPNAFQKYTSDLLSKWKISSSSSLKWQPFFLAWALYVERPVTRDGEEDQPPTDGFYLEHFDRFRELYDAGNFDEALASWHKRPFRGLVVVVAPELDSSTDSLAGYIAKELGGAPFIGNVNDITPERMVGFYEPGSGAVCYASVEGGLKNLRKILKYGADGVSLVLFGCSEHDIRAMGRSDEDAARLAGMMRNWKKTRCSCISELPVSLLVKEDNVEAGTVSTLQPNDAFHEAVSQIRNVATALKPFDSRPGALVFFPGIPGCGKSSLLGDATLKQLRAFVQAMDRERPRKLAVQVGDKTKQKFWPLVKQDRLLDPSCIYLADKNVPYQTWLLVAEICASTKGVAVPILPNADAFRTTKLQFFRRANGDLVEKEHYYPFSLQYLAVCMARVVARPAGDHDGKLDSGEARACMIMAKLFSLYRNISSDDFCERMKSSFNREGALLSKPVEVPFFTKSGGSDPLPADLEETLIHLLQAQYGFDLSKTDTSKVQDAFVDDLENRLRSCLVQYRDDLLGRTVEQSSSCQAFVSQLNDRLANVDSMDSYNDTQVIGLPNIKIASIDIDVQSVRAALQRLEKDERLATFWEMAVDDTSPEKEDSASSKYQSEKFSRNPHVTMAHCKEKSQADMRSAFEPICESRVKVTATSFLWSTQVAALEVSIAKETEDGKAVPRPDNAFFHATIWCQDGVSPFQSNSLPGLVETEEARRIELQEPVIFYGTISLWPLNKH